MDSAEIVVIQDLFHQLIRKRASEFGVLSNLKKCKVELPKLALNMAEKRVQEATEHENNRLWFAVPGMYGGFAYKLVEEDGQYKLLCESWSRVCEGSGQSHCVTAEGITLIDEGFV